MKDIQLKIRPISKDLFEVVELDKNGFEKPEELPGKNKKIMHVGRLLTLIEGLAALAML